MGEMTSDVSFHGKTLKAKGFVLKNITNLFVTDWMEPFNSRDLTINIFCKNLNDSSDSTNKALENFRKKKLKQIYPEDFFLRNWVFAPKQR